MKRTIYLLPMLVFLSLSCTQPNTVKPMTKAEFDRKVDSIIHVKGPKVIKEMQADFEVRKDLIIRPKVDSILGIQQQKPQINIPTEAIEEGE